MSGPGRPVRFFNPERDGSKRFDGFDGGMTLGGNSVWVTGPTLLANLIDDMTTFDARWEDWAPNLGMLDSPEYRAVGPNGETLYLMPDINVEYEDESDGGAAGVDEAARTLVLGVENDLDLALLVDVMQREGIVIAPSNLIAIEGEYNRRRSI